jgi:D-alanine--poly(phosphoribitol) ligase subunit 1
VTHPPDVIEKFLAAARRFAEKPAIAALGQETTYAALETRARQYAHLVAQQDEPRIFIALPRGPDAYAAMLGTALGGGFYAPANEASPPEKLQRVVRELAPTLCICPPNLAPILAEAAPTAQIVDPASVSLLPALQGNGRRHRIAYIIFTSGSTGVPKGVVIPRTALDHYISWIHASACITQEDRVSQFNNLAFDVSVFDIFGALACGATLIPIGGKFDRLMPARAIARERITVWTSVPTVIDLMRTSQQLTNANLATVRLFTLAGEALLRPQVEALFDACPHAKVQNAYGPTEATVTVSSMMMTKDDYQAACDRNAISIGPPTEGMTLHIAGGPHGNEGELVIIGPQLADGYWRDPARTQAAFRPITIGGVTRRGYFTGDWVERIDGLIYYRQRIDHQTKIRGYRIELDEVAAAILRCGWPGACVFKRNDELAAVVECPDPAAFDANDLRTALATLIEPYAIPEHILAVTQLPRTENDKIDRAGAESLFAHHPTKAP